MRHLMHSHDGPIFTIGKSPRGKTCYYDKKDLDAWAARHKWRLKHETNSTYSISLVDIASRSDIKRIN